MEKINSKKPKIDQTRINAAAEAIEKKQRGNDEEEGFKKREKTPKKVKGTGRKAGFTPTKGGGGGGGERREARGSKGSKFGGKGARPRGKVPSKGKK